MQITKKQKLELEKESQFVIKLIENKIQSEKAKITTEIEQKIKQEKQFILIQDGAIASFLSDTFTFAALAAVLAINHLKFDDSTFGSWMLGIIFFIAVWGKAKNKAIKIKGKEQLIQFLKSLEKK